ncbi:replication factor C small subunit [Candidatus Woesearchaeota archaeon]|nr:replication factor C small subunit [Candidatus Woesearchaeota archaeon]
MQRIWTEKHRPQTFKEVIGQDKIVEIIEAMTKNKNIPNLLFAGPAGVGKSTVALVIAKELFGDRWRENFLELNSSDERGIDIIRGVIKDFSRTRAMGDVPFKLIFLDECDSLTKEAQQALRRTMENYTDNVRFILSCNYSSKLIDPIQSRCSVFRFKPLDKEGVKKVIEKIKKEEGLTINEKISEALYDISDGDVRRVINILQSCASLNKVITEDLVFSLVSAARPKEVKEVLEFAVDGDFIKSRDKLLDTMLKHGLSGLDVIKQIQKEILNLNIKDEKKLILIEKCGEVEFRMVEGSDEYLQLESLLAAVVLYGK